MASICGIDCSACDLKEKCAGCTASNGKPFGGKCIIAVCCKSKGGSNCNSRCDSKCDMKKQLIAEFNALNIPDMAEVDCLYSLRGSFINLEYTLPDGQSIKLLDDKKIYLGNQIEKAGSDRCYGLAADENYLLVCEYGCGGSDAEIVIYKRRF